MYRYVPVFTDFYDAIVQVGMDRYVLCLKVHTGTYLYVRFGKSTVHTSMPQLVYHGIYRYIPVHTGTWRFSIGIFSSTQQYIPVRTCSWRFIIQVWSRTSRYITVYAKILSSNYIQVHESTSPVYLFCSRCCSTLLGRCWLA